jgi:PilZ domain
METQQSIMGKTPPAGGTAPKKVATTERRGSRRCKITQLMRIRPSDPEKDHFDDMRGTLSVSRTGVYFQTSEPGYEIGMRLFLTLPYSQAPMSLNREYLAEVVRRDPLSTGMFGIGLKILMEMGVQQPAVQGFSNTPW